MFRKGIGAAVACLAVALGAGVATADDGQVDVSVTIPGATATPTGPRGITDAALSWAINAESGSGAYFGGCNFLSAGRAADSGSSRLWRDTDGLYRASDANVSIEKPSGAATWKLASFGSRCQDERGATPRAVTTSASDYGTGNRFAITGGVGRVDTAKGTATIAWKGSVTVVAYGGLSYFWLSDPVLNVSGGSGTLSATVGGYASSREDATAWAPLPQRSVTLARLTSVQLSGLGLSSTPAYRGVSVTNADGNAEQYRSGADWGAFPQDFVSFQDDVGQSAYWYSTGSMRDFAKPPTPISVSWSAADRIDDKAPVNPPRGDQSAAPGVRPAPSSSANPGVGTRTPGAAARATTKAAPKAATTPVSAAAGNDSYPATTPDALQAGVRGLIPAAAAALEDPRAALVTASSALVALSTLATVGFRRRWFVLPWSRKSSSDPL